MNPEVRLAGSRAAAIILKQRAIDGYNKNPNTCQHCLQIIELKGQKPFAARKKKFCSHACSARFNNPGHPRRKPEGQCDVCSAVLPTKKKYCSTECKGKAQWLRFKDRKKQNTPAGHVVVWRQKAKQKAVEYKGGRCEACGYDRCLNALDFHHIDPSKKSFQISGSSKSFETIQAEVDKCLLLCSNCHREVHAGLIDVLDIVMGV